MLNQILCKLSYPRILGFIKLIINIFFLFLAQGRASLTSEKQRFAHEHGEMKNLEDIVREIKPTVLIGNFFYFKAMTLFFVGKKGDVALSEDKITFL